ncbi:MULTISPECIES: hypothetical protein [Actinomycetes]|uniref:hypothetical protein n=1 Tax=Actinomycetes TaxID=1760 RepID=UPI001319C91F|nr:MULTISPECIES: hypothetical protein [Actinomycetes]
MPASDTYVSVLPSLANGSAEAIAWLVLDAARGAGRSVTAGRRTRRTKTAPENRELARNADRKGHKSAAKRALEHAVSQARQHFPDPCTGRAHENIVVDRLGLEPRTDGLKASVWSYQFMRVAGGFGG